MLTQYVALIYKDSTSKLFCCEIKNPMSETIHFRISGYYAELVHWAKEHNARIKDLDSDDLIREMLEE
jgi:hypothetical protein